jgi:hypothetical protein
MMLVLEARTPCPVCGCYLRCFAFPSARVNKRSIRPLPGGYLWTGPGACPECGFDAGMGAPRLSFTASPWRLTTESQAEVEAYRARRWPETRAA